MLLNLRLQFILDSHNIYIYYTVNEVFLEYILYIYHPPTFICFSLFKINIHDFTFFK